MYILKHYFKPENKTENSDLKKIWYQNWPFTGPTRITLLLSNQVAGLQLPAKGAFLKSISPLVRPPGIQPGYPDYMSSLLTTTQWLRRSIYKYIFFCDV